MYFKFKILVTFFLLTSSFSYAQISNKKCKWIKVTGGEFSIEDSLSVLPSSVKLSYPADSSIKIEYNINSNKAKLSSTENLDSILVCYSVLPFYLNKTRYNRNPSLLDSNSYYKEDFYSRRPNAPIESREELFSSPGLNKTGNISRGISFGNNQNVFVNSALNLQLDGRLTDDITITAVISDQNIPFQPEGTTQQLQEFDKVYVQLKSKNSSIIAGDIVMKNKPSNFLRYYKNVQGGQVEINSTKDSSINSSTAGGVAISKGKFASMQFAKGQLDEPIEGVQGPYRLRGSNNERFITVLANSEKVYLDGRLLVRGFDYDYIIDYNQAEITFTNSILITKFSVIRVDFEFTDRNYSRSIINGSHYQNFGKADAFINFYEEKDNPRNPLTVDLRDQDKLLLSGIGDTLTKAFISGANDIGYVSNRILYKDSVGIYVYSTDSSVAVYEVTFSDLGQGKGRYALSTSTANGRVYVYIGPGLGRYEPLKNIPTPRKKQMVTVGGGYKIGKNDRVYGEFARSNEDINLFSDFDDGDNGGNAFKVGYINTGKNIGFLKKYKWLGSVDYEYNEKTFIPIDRFRDPNFERDWSSDPTILADNHIINGSVSLIKNAENNFSYRVSRRLKENDVNGTQQYASLSQRIGNLQLISNGFLLYNNRTYENSNWKRFNSNIAYHSKYVIPGIVYTTDKNRVISDTTGKIVRSAMYFDEVKFYIRSNDTLRLKYFADHSIREDKSPFDGALVADSKSNTSNVGVSTDINENNQISSSFTYRYLENKNIGGSQIPNEETVLGRVDWNSNIFKRHVRSELTITTGTGRESKRQFIYIPVPVGEGTHFWNDVNGDAVQDLDEFFEALYTTDKKFIKSFIPTDEYIRAYINTFSYRLDATAPRSWRGKGKVKSFISKFSNISSWTINKRITDDNMLARFLPTIDNIESTDILSVQKSLRSTMFYNRSNPQYGMDLSYFINENKQFLTQGFEQRISEDLKFNTRVNIKQYANVKFAVLRGTKTHLSDFLSSRNYKIETWKFTPEGSYQPKNNLRVTFNVSYMQKLNTFPGSNGEEATFYEGGLEVKINKVSQRTINGNIKYIRIFADFKGTSSNTALGYEMLEALQPGNNYTWNVTWQERLSNGLQLSFVYEGRKSDLSDIIHIGRMQVSALF